MSGRSLDDLTLTFSWRDLWVLIMRWRKTPGTATCEAIEGVERWSPTDQLLAGIFDLLQLANWQRAGKKNAPKPKPLPRPWDKARVRKLGSQPIPISKFNDWWNAKAGGRDGRRRRARNRMGTPGPQL